MGVEGDLWDCGEDIAGYIDWLFDDFFAEQKEIIPEFEKRQAYATIRIEHMIWDAFSDVILEDVMMTYEGVKSYIDTMIDDVTTDLYNVTHYFDMNFDEAVSDIKSLLGFSYDAYNKDIISIEGDILHRVDNIEKDLEDSIYALTADEMEKLKNLADKADTLLGLLEGDVSGIVEEVRVKLFTIMQEYIDPQIDLLWESVFELDEAIASQGNIVYQALMWIVNWVVTGFKIPPQDIETAVSDIHKWIADEVEKQTITIKTRLTILEDDVLKFSDEWIAALKKKLAI